MNSSKVLTIVAVFAIALAAFNLIITMNKVGKLTGFAANEGNASLIVQSTVSLNFTTNNINWSSGYVNSTCSNAFLDSEGNGGPGNCDVNWIAQANGLILRNEGNINVSVALQSDKNAAAFIGGSTGGGPIYNWKVRNNETGSCVSGLNPIVYTSVSTTPITICSNLGSQYGGNANTDSLRIDVNITIPSDAYTPSFKISKLTATGTAI